MLAYYRSLFISHGTPDAALADTDATRIWRNLGRQLRCKATVVVSAHWMTPTLIVKSAQRLAPVMDFHGFDPRLRLIDYAPSGNLQRRDLTNDLLHDAGLSPTTSNDPHIDHGVWVPLSVMWPDADVEAVQVSIPSGADEPTMLAIGRALRGLPEDVLIIGSGGAVHNLRTLAWDAVNAEPDEWAVEFQRWLDHALAQARSPEPVQLAAAPHARLAHPTTEHWLPLMVAAGAAQLPPDAIYAGFEHANLSMAVYGFPHLDSGVLSQK